MGLMPKELPKGVSTDRDRRGNVRIYFRATGRPKVRLKQMPGTRAFEEEVACARLGLLYTPPDAAEAHELVRKLAPQGSFLWLLQQYKARVKLEPNNRARRIRLLEEIAESTHRGRKRGWLPYALMERKHVLEIRDEIRDTPGAQNDVVKVISAMFGWAIEHEVGNVKFNPALGIKRLNSGDGFHAWTVDEVRQYEAKHKVGSKARLALHLAMFTGLRISDLAKVGRQYVKNGWLTIRPGKTSGSSKVVVELPIIEPLQKTLDSSPVGNMTYLTTEYKKPFSVHGLGNKMRQWCDEAGLPHCSMHGLRKAGATIAAENGATDEELMALFGWVTKSQTTHYTKSARRKKIAQGAAHKLIPEEQTRDEIVPPDSGVDESGAETAKKRSKING